MSRALKSISVGVVVERRKAVSQWIDFLWRPAQVLVGVPDTAPWTKLSDDGETATFYVGAGEIELYPSDTTQYRDNLLSGTPMLWVGLRATDSEPPYELHAVTADTAEGESMTETASNLVEPVPMPAEIAELLARFVTEHHVERVFFKRKRDRADPESLGRRPVVKGKDG